MNVHGAAGALLFVQYALVKWFLQYLGDDPAQKIADAFRAFHIRPLDPPPDPILYDEPRAGTVNFFRIGNASVDVEVETTRVMYTIDQEIEAYCDPVRGRAAVLVMGDLIEKAFAPSVPVIDVPHVPHGGPGIPLEPWLRPSALALPSPVQGEPALIPTIRVTDMTETDSRIGYSVDGLTYSVIMTWQIIAETL